MLLLVIARWRETIAGRDATPIAIDGGGMRGVVSAGMTAAIELLGLTACFDLVIGASARALNGAGLLAGVADACCNAYHAVFTTRRFSNPYRLLIGRAAVERGCRGPRHNDIDLQRSQPLANAALELPSCDRLRIGVSCCVLRSGGNVRVARSSGYQRGETNALRAARLAARGVLQQLGTPLFWELSCRTFHALGRERRSARPPESSRARGRRWTTPTGKPPQMDRVARAMAVELPDGRCLSLEFWPGDGAPLVLLHDLLDCAVGWKHLAAIVDRPCYAFDLPGFGDSDRPTRNRVSAYAEDVQAALAALDVHDFTLVGHSLGGAVAAGLAERLRDHVAALVLMAPVGFGRIHLAEAIQLPGVHGLVHRSLPLVTLSMYLPTRRSP